MRSAIRPSKRTFFFYLTPATLLYAFTTFLPIAFAVYYGFFNWKGGKKMTFIGLKNYQMLFKDAGFWDAFQNNIYLVVACLIGQIGLALLFAILLNSRFVKFKGIHRTFGYFPVTISAVVVGFVWGMIYDYNYGLLNNFLRLIGRADLAQAWLNDAKNVMFYATIPLIWQYIGYYMIILLSAFAAIDTQIFEMAEIDGASGWRKAIHITIPLLKNTLLVCITLCISGNLKAFDHIYTLTAGGPGTASNVVAYYAYNSSFIRYKMGYGNAMSIMILILSVILIVGSRFIVSRFTSKEAI